MIINLYKSIGLIFFFLSTNNLFAQVILDSVVVTEKKWDQKAMFEKEGRENALKDISEGKVYIYVYGYIIKELGTENLDEQIDSLAKVYGFEYKLGGCYVPPERDAYYDEVMNFLEQRNGVGWKKKFDDEVKILRDAFYTSKKE